MEGQATMELLRHFRNISDSRASNASHRLEDLLSIAILAVLSGCEGWTAVEAWAHVNVEWLQTFLALPHGIPSHDTFDRFFSMLNPMEFEQCFMAWTAGLIEQSNALFIAVDGKTLRHSFKHAWSKTSVHLVSAFVARNSLVLGQVATDQKSNEITAIPKLLALLDLRKATVTIDAMGCQREIASQIVEQQGDYILAVKENQLTLHQKTKALLDEAILDNFAGMSHAFFQESAKGHGRLETRRVWVTNEVQHLGANLQALWKGLASVACVESTRQNLGDLTGKVTTERRYFISSHEGSDAQLLANAIRSHWGVENGLHWRLDVQMNEDACRLRVKNGAENFSRLRRIALNKLKNCEYKTPSGKILKRGIRAKQQICGWSRNFLMAALLA